MSEPALPETSRPPSPGAESPLELLLVTGLSGAGKSTALQVLEDLGFFTADGLPPEVIPDFCAMLGKPGMEHFRGLALGPDFRRGGMQSLDMVLGKLRGRGAQVSLIFLEARPDIILRRYATTRRPHPLEREGLNLEQAMEAEIRSLVQVRDEADLVLDTSSFSLHDLRRRIQRRWGEASAQSPAMRVNCVSFGFKYGVPSEADLVFDLRFLPNPYFEESLRPFSGQNKAVADYVFHTPEARLFRDKFVEFLLFLLPLYDAEGRYRLTVGLGCTGGRHRSVALTELVAHEVSRAGFAVSVEHRHLNLG